MDAKERAEIKKLEESRAKFLADLLKARVTLGESLAHVQQSLEMFYDRSTWTERQVIIAIEAAGWMKKVVSESAKYIESLANRAARSKIVLDEGLLIRLGEAVEMLLMSAKAIGTLLADTAKFLDTENVQSRNAFTVYYKYFFGGGLSIEEDRPDHAWAYARSAWTMLFYATQSDKNIKRELDAEATKLYHDDRVKSRDVWNFDDPSGVLIFGNRTLADERGPVAFSREQVSKLKRMYQEDPSIDINKLGGFLKLTVVKIPNNMIPSIQEYTNADDIAEQARIEAAKEGKYVEVYGAPDLNGDRELLYVARPDERKIYEAFVSGLRDNAAKPWGELSGAEPGLKLNRKLTKEEQAAVKRYVTDVKLDATIFDIVALIKSDSLWIEKSGERYKGKEFEYVDPESQLWDYRKDEHGRTFVIYRGAWTFNRKLHDSEVRVIRAVLKENKWASIQDIAKNNLGLDVVPLATKQQKRELAERFGDPGPTGPRGYTFTPNTSLLALTQAKEELDLFEYIWSAKF